MAVDAERHQRICAAINESSIDALVCWSPTEVLLLTGYWPVMGSAVAVFAADGTVHAVVPEDEVELAERASAVKITSYKPGGLDSLSSPLSTIGPPLTQVLKSSGLAGKTVAIETQQGMQPASYADSVDFRGSLAQLLQELGLSIKFVPCEPVVEPLKATKTSIELEHMRLGARIVADGFAAAAACIVPGMRESEVAAEAQYAFEVSPHAEGVQRSYGFFYCMSGPDSAKASAAFAFTGQRRILAGDLVLVHANTCADGYWTDVTRTYTAGTPTPRHIAMRSAIDEASAAALQVIRPGASARDVDRAARAIMERHGFGEAFRHSTGHGVGFAAANPNGMPRIHPHSPDMLDVGMTFNIEPAAYFDGYGGMRHCDVVAVTLDGAAVLTDF